MLLSEAEQETLDKLLYEVVRRRDIASEMNDTTQWKRYATAETVLVELREEEEEMPL
jgi:hypothetical protein